MAPDSRRTSSGRTHRPLDRSRGFTTMAARGAAVVESDRLLTTNPSLGYDVIILPKVGVSERADFMLRTLSD